MVEETTCVQPYPYLEIRLRIYCNVITIQIPHSDDGFEFNETEGVIFV